MELIDKNALNFTDLEIVMCEGDFAKAFKLICEKLDDAPIIEAEPVKHGKWVNDNGLYRCSVCNNFTITGWASCIPIEQMNKTMKYCNNCGAKMDGEEDE